MSDPAQTLEFVESCVPPITAGRYTVTVQQDITELDENGKNKTPGLAKTYVSPSRTVHVQGERFSLNPRDIEGVFPPEGGVGDYGNENALPHITFLRKSLPWEQGSGLPAVQHRPPPPWLALLVFHESDEGGLPTIAPATVGDLSFEKRDSTPLRDGRGGKPVIASYADLASTSPWELRTGEDASDACLIVDIPVTLFRRIAPTVEDLGWLAHSRIAAGPSARQPLSAVIANRLPLREGSSVACLVSLEQIATCLLPASVIAVKGRAATHLRLVVLKAWGFRCGADLQGFHHPISIGPLKVPLTLTEAPTPEDLQVKQALAMGYTALDHHTRWGDQAVSWYRGPFLPFSSKVTDSIPRPPICADGYETGVRPLSCADEALRYDPELGMLDVSYAAAWQLGRLLALRDESFARDLYQWKRENKRKILAPQVVDVFAFLAEILQAAAQSLDPAQSARDLVNDPIRLKAHLAGTRAPESVVSRLDKLRRLEGVPLDYLVPDERMLPPESLRFFQVDLNWIYSLVEGAYSIARVSTEDQKQDAATCPHEVYTQVSGFLLRSKLVSEWPRLQAQIEVSDRSAIVKTLRCERITPDILLCLVEVQGQGVITSATLQVPQERIEFHLPKSARFRDLGRSVVDINPLAAEEGSAADFAVSLALKPFVTPNFVVDKTMVYPGDSVRVHADDSQDGVWYAVWVASETSSPQFFKTGQSIGYVTAPLLTDTTIDVLAEFPLHGRRKRLLRFSITVSKRVPPDDSPALGLVSTMYGELLPHEFYLGKVPHFYIRESQKGVSYQLLVNHRPVGAAVPGGGQIDIPAIELRGDATYFVRATRVDDIQASVELKQSVRVTAVPDIYIDVMAANSVNHANTSVPSGRETQVLIADSQLGVTYTLLTWPLNGDEARRRTVSSAVGTGKRIELSTGPLLASSYFRVTAKLPGSRLVDLRQEVLVHVDSPPPGMGGES
nr:hypothetical protein [uncultured Albidiferax sp.]